MSFKHALEPPTSGKVILNTTHGEIHIDLWCRETPLACRNFIQLCLEGYFDNTPFYRVIANFLIQAGNEESDESIYGESFRDEFHSRLKFSHRGMVAMVNRKMNDNRSHFFITTDKADFLNRKNTIFGKIANNTIYNAIRISEVDVDPTDRPLILPRILSCLVKDNPFEDIIPREKVLEKPVTEPTSRKKEKAKIIINYDDEEPTQGRIKSSHDALNDPSLSKTASFQEPEVQQEVQKTAKFDQSSSEDEDFDLKMKKKLLSEREIFIDSSVKVGNYNVKFNRGQTILTKSADVEFDEMKKKYLRLKSNPLGSNNPQVIQQEKDLQTFLTPLQKLQYKFHSYKKKTKGRETETLSKLDSFISKLSDSQQNDWFSQKLKFSTDSAKAFGFNKDLPAKSLPDVDIVSDPTKRLKSYEDDDLRALQDILSADNLLKISSKNK